MPRRRLSTASASRPLKGASSRLASSEKPKKTNSNANSEKTTQKTVSSQASQAGRVASQLSSQTPNQPASRYSDSPRKKTAQPRLADQFQPFTQGGDPIGQCSLRYAHLDLTHPTRRLVRRWRLAWRYRSGCGHPGLTRPDRPVRGARHRATGRCVMCRLRR